MFITLPPNDINKTYSDYCGIVFNEHLNLLNYLLILLNLFYKLLLLIINLYAERKTDYLSALSICLS